MMRVIAFVTLLLAVSLTSAHTSQELYVLCYHSFLKSGSKYNTPPEELKRQLLSLKNEGFTFISYNDIKNNRKQNKKSILVTVDDGNHSLYDAYFAVMKPLGIKPVIAVYPGVINKKSYALTWNQLRELQEDGCTIASHGFYHEHLNEQFCESKPKLLKREIVTSKKLIEKKLGRPVEIFVYPYGGYCETAIREVKQAGYKRAFTVNRGPLRDTSDNLLLPRIMITRYSWKSAFNFKPEQFNTSVEDLQINEPQELVHREIKRPANQEPELLRYSLFSDVPAEPVKKVVHPVSTTSSVFKTHNTSDMQNQANILSFKMPGTRKGKVLKVKRAYKKRIIKTRCFYVYTINKIKYKLRKLFK